MATLTRMDSPVLFAVDSATETLLLAVGGPHGDATAIVPGGAQASAALLPHAAALLASIGLGWNDVDAIGYGQGPGAFTGLRTACAVAQGLAFGLERPVLPIDSLLIVAEAARAGLGGTASDAGTRGDGGTGVWFIAQDARMGELYAAVYEQDAAGWRVRMAPALCTPAEAAAHLAALGQPVHAVGTGSSMLRGDASGASGQHWIEAPVWEPARAQALLTLARRAWARGEGRPAREAAPVYVRDKVALTTAERALKAAATPLAPAQGPAEGANHGSA